MQTWGLAGEHRELRGSVFQRLQGTQWVSPDSITGLQSNAVPIGTCLLHSYRGLLLFLKALTLVQTYAMCYATRTGHNWLRAVTWLAVHRRHNFVDRKFAAAADSKRQSILCSEQRADLHVSPGLDGGISSHNGVV